MEGFGPSPPSPSPPPSPLPLPLPLHPPSPVPPPPPSPLSPSHLVLLLTLLTWKFRSFAQRDTFRLSEAQGNILATALRRWEIGLFLQGQNVWAECQ